MLLEGKVAAIYGGGGAIGGAVARRFARDGATIFLAGRTQEKLDQVAQDITARGGTARTAIVDALDEQAVNSFVDSIVEETGRIDISFNLINTLDVQKRLFDISIDEFLQPIVTATRTQFLTSIAAARHMKERGSGVILFFGGGGPQTMPGLGGFKVSLDAIESLRRQLTHELGEYGIRVVTLKTGGIVDTIPAHEPMRDAIVEGITNATVLKRPALLKDVGNVSTFIASDLARTITGTEINISCGSIVE